MNDSIDNSTNLDQIAQLKRGTHEILLESDLVEKIRSGKKLNVKAGFDPSAPDLHFGHLVLFNKLRQFQDWGHHVQFIIGDFTARIGDPTGKNVTRQPLSAEQIAENAQTYQAQAFKILKPEQTTVYFNATWLEPLGADGLLRLGYHSTVARMLEREDFSKRYQDNQPIALSEFFYPLLQGYDSVHLKSDVEIGGTDQIFNLLMGRQLQKEKGMKPQTVITLPILVGLDGEKKMSKSLGNYIAFDEDATNMFGKIMSIPDKFMWDYFAYLTSHSEAQITAYKQSIDAGVNPRDVKFELGKTLVARFYDKDTADQCEAQFRNQFSKKLIPDNIEHHVLPALEDGALPLVVALKTLGLCKSTSEAIRLIEQDAVSVDRVRIGDKQHRLERGKLYLVQVGKRRFVQLEIS